MPDVRGFRSEAAKKSVGVWNNEKRYEYLLADFDLLDQSDQLGRAKDKLFIEMLNELADEPISKFIKSNQLEVDLENEKYDINGFIGAYQALSWILAMSNPRFRYWAMFKVNPSYEEWIRDYKEFTEGERIAISEKVTSPELMKLLLDPLEESPVSDYYPDEVIKIDDGSYPGHDLIDIASASKNPILLRYLANKFPTVHNGSLYRFISGGDVEALKIALKKQKFGNFDVLNYVDEAFESGSVEMVNYIEKTKGSKLDMSKLSIYKINNALSDNNIQTVKWAEERGYKLTVDDLVKIVTSKGVKNEMLDYVISKLPPDQSVFTNTEIGVGFNGFTQRSPFVASVRISANLRYMIDNYGDLATNKQWEEALDLADAYYDVFIKKRYMRIPVDIDDIEKSIDILLKVHHYPKELLEEYQSHNMIIYHFITDNMS